MGIELCTAGIFVEVSNTVYGNLRTEEGTKKSDSISEPNFGVVPIKNSCKVAMEPTYEWMLVGC